MADMLKVALSVEEGVVILRVTYDPGQMFERKTGDVLSEQLTSKYEEATLPPNPAGPDCIVVMDAQTAGSPMVKSLFELYMRVNNCKGKLICANYPADYIDSILAIGLPSLEGFRLATDKEEAFKKLEK